MSDDQEYVWVSVDFLRGGVATAWRGRMNGSDFEALLSGSYLGPFVRLERVHWWERYWDPAKKCNAVRMKRYGDDGECRDYDGAIFLRPELIVDVATLNDCEPLFERTECVRYEAPLPGADLAAEPQPVKVASTSSGDHA
jgi:hypothetical protein